MLTNVSQKHFMLSCVAIVFIGAEMRTLAGTLGMVSHLQPSLSVSLGGRWDAGRQGLVHLGFQPTLLGATNFNNYRHGR